MSPTAEAAAVRGLTDEQIAQFRQDGYLVIPRFFDPASLLSRSKALVQDFSLEGHPLTTFSTGRDDDDNDNDNNEEEEADQKRKHKRHVGDEYFLSSGDKVHYFLEEEAIGPDGQLNRPKDRAVNKIGHALHLHDEEFHSFSFSPQMQAIARSLGVHNDPRVLQSMVICKQPSIGAAVPHHNDSTFLYTDPPSAIGFWAALQDCTVSNGCLSFLKGSHRWPRGISPPTSSASRPIEEEAISKLYGVQRGINARFVRKGPLSGDVEGSDGTTFITLDQQEEAQWDEQLATVEECQAGSLVLIHGSVLHQSKKNLSETSRYIYTFHMIEGDPSRAQFDEGNWLQMPRGTDGKRMAFSQLNNPPPPPPAVQPR